jgi:hypothetical protein
MAEPKNGDMLYRVWNGVLEKARFIRVRYNDAFVHDQTGKKYPSYECRRLSNEYTFVCPTDMYETTELKAWLKYEKECYEAEKACAKGLEEAQKQADYVQFEIAKALENIRRVGS